MKKMLLLMLFVFLTNNFFAQHPNLKDKEGYVGGGLGMSWIDGDPYYSFRIFPEFSFSKIGLGLDLRLDFDKSGSLRKENYNEFSDYLSIIRYLRYGFKGDPVYARLGALDYATLGHGSIVYLYNNSTSFDTRKVGLELDVDFNKFGFETVYGNFLQSGLLGFRGYIRPLQFTALSKIPVLGNLEVGATVATDMDKRSNVTSSVINANTGQFDPVENGSMTIYGFDLGLPIVKTGAFNWDIYFDYSKIADYGSGSAAGTKLALNGLGLLTASLKFEKRFNNDQYIPSYFNSLYEIERLNFNPVDGNVQSKASLLLAATNIGNGNYGELQIGLLGLLNILGSYQRLDKAPNSGILHLSADISPKQAPFVARAGYDKAGIGNESAIFKVDDRTFMFAEFGYKPMSYLLVSFVYTWTFTPMRDADDNVISYVPQKKVEPRISFIYPLGM
ncbi:MAG: hypothetical protein K9I71_00745 [Ignavibacteriales bacterium]|nr:hypothetical protein [Ignavibacteriales bacterium]MCF8314613.1 hypothetical protein [Ignavibacteriales bacterium]MCF8436350.1 hypothetical protein [Ignavibacteriales bacterium]